MDKLFVRFTDWVEHVFTSWWGVLAYIVIMWACLYFGDWDTIDRYVYISNAVIVVLLLNASKRDSLATHTKLDDLVPPEHYNLEKKTASEIEATQPVDEVK